MGIGIVCRLPLTSKVLIDELNGNFCHSCVTCSLFLLWFSSKILYLKFSVLPYCLNLIIILPPRAGNLIGSNLGAEVTSDVTSSSGPVKLEDLQRILSNIEPAGMSYLLKNLYHIHTYNMHVTNTDTQYDIEF